MTREEHIAGMVEFVWQHLGVNLLPEGEATLVLFLWRALAEAIEEEMRQASSLYERAQKASVN